MSLIVRYSFRSYSCVGFLLLLVNILTPPHSQAYVSSQAGSAQSDIIRPSAVSAIQYVSPDTLLLTIHEDLALVDSVSAGPAPVLRIVEEIGVTDDASLTSSLFLAVSETLGVMDAPVVLETTRLVVQERISVRDEEILSCGEECESISRQCELIDFETVPGQDVVDGMEIHGQYESSLGISFILADETYPHIAQVGSPTTAFEPDDTPTDLSVQTFFLTDDGELSGSTSSPLIVNFTNPVDSAAGILLDIDFSESFEITARSASNSVLDRITISAGDEGTGDAAATPWSFSRPTADVFSIRIEGSRQSGRFGLGFDNFVTCAPNRVTSVETEEQPTDLRLKPNYPNPFNPSTSIGFSLPETMRIRLAVYDVIGREIEVLLHGMLAGGEYVVVFDAGNLPSGTYFYRLEAGSSVQTQAMLLVK